MLLPVLLALLAPARAEEDCLPDGSALYPLPSLPERAALEARVGPTIAALATTWHGDTYLANGGPRVGVLPDDGRVLPRELRLPLPAPPPLEARAVVALPERRCLPLDTHFPGFDSGGVAIGVPVDLTVEVLWSGRVIETLTLPRAGGVGVGWNEEGAVFVARETSCGFVPLGADAPVEAPPFASCLDGAWQTALARGKWGAGERAAIVALLARAGFAALPFDAQVALAARADLTGAERAAIQVPAKGRASGTATFGLEEGAPRPRVAVNGVPATTWRADGALALPAVGRATVSIEHPPFKEGGASWTRTIDTWLADGVAFAAHPAWGPVVTAEKEAPRCGLVPADTPGVWACGDRPVTPGVPFPLPCPRPLAMGDLAWVTVGEDPDRRGLTFLPAAPGTYTFRELDGRVTFERTAPTCP